MDYAKNQQQQKQTHCGFKSHGWLMWKAQAHNHTVDNASNLFVCFVCVSVYICVKQCVSAVP